MHTNWCVAGQWGNPSWTAVSLLHGNPNR